MINLKVLGAAAVLALALPAITPTESFAQAPPHHGPGAGGGAPRGAGAGPHLAGPRVSGAGPRVYGGGGHFAGGGDHRYGSGLIPGAVAGAVIGGAIAAQGPYYGGTPYYGGNPYYYGAGGDDDSDGPVVQVAPDSGGGDVTYCMQTYRSYDPRSGTYVGFDGYRHPCP
jgi:hypothetical protein